MQEQGEDVGARGVPVLRPEDELLLLCARTRVTPAQERCIRDLASGRVDWEALVEGASWHGVLPLVTHSVLTLCPDAVPVPIFNALLRRREGVARFNRALALELVRLLALCKREGIDALGFKGPVLAASVYGNLALREGGDLDILVRPRDSVRAHHLLLAEGYRVGPHQGRGMTFLHRLTFVHYHRLYEHPGKGMDVELHWRINPRYIAVPLDSTDVWRRLEGRRLLSTTVPDLAPEDVLLQLCLHGSKHVWGRLRYVCDVAACLERYPALDWPQFLTRARRLRGERMVFVALELARRLLDAPLPERVAREIGADPMVAALTAQLAARLISRQDFDSHFGALAMIPYWLQLKSHRRDRLLVYPYVALAIWLKLQPTYRDRAVVGLPGRLAPLYYLVRLVRIGAIGGGLIRQTLVRGLRAGRAQM